MNGDQSCCDAPPAHDPRDADDPLFSRRPPATTPGAVAVVRRGMELLDEDEWDPTEPQESDDDSESQTYLDASVAPRIMNNLHEMSNKQMLLYASIVVLILGGATAGIIIGLSNNGPDSYTEPTNYTTAPVSRCDFTDMVQPNPILQCACDGKITVLTDNVRSNYTELKESFIPNLFPDESFNYPIKSCEHQNAALLWLAMDAENQTQESMRNRYLLAVLYSYWRGLEWTDDEGWLTSASECTWSGITCSSTLVSEIDLHGNNLQGSLVTELGLFRDVRKYHTRFVFITDYGMG